VLGAEPHVYANARDLDASDTDPVTTFGSWTMTASPTYDEDGWDSSLPTVNLDGATQYGDAASEATRYNGAPPFVWVWSGVSASASESGDEHAMFEASGGGQFILLRRNHGNDLMEAYIRTDAAVLYQPFGPAAIPTGPIHIGMMWDGLRLLVKVLHSGR